MNQVLFEGEDRNEPRGLLYDIQGERVKTLYTQYSGAWQKISKNFRKKFLSSLSSLLTLTRVRQGTSGGKAAIMNSPNWIFLMPESLWLKRS